jgi:hypothetical protein
MKKSLVALYWILVLFACNSGEENKIIPVENPLFKVLSASETGINFTNKLTSSPELNILNYLYFYNGAGVCVSDFNNDRLPDLFFISNQGQNEFYLNKGKLQFENTTQSAQIPNSIWSTGATAVDINQDGLMDIYVCQVTGLNDIKTQNQLLVNQGLSADSIPIFKDEAEKYGLNFSSYAQQAGFFDYDNDGDLDMFLLNHSLHPNRTYGNGNKRLNYHPIAGDKLFENQNGIYIEVTKDKAIFSSEIGYGLDFSLSDINLDGYTDLYVGNDFFENDYLYINQQGNSFKDRVSSEHNPLGHTTHFSMGNAIADINNDLQTDILSVDMLPAHVNEYKVSGTEYPFLTYRQYLKNNYSPQYMSNTLHINQGNLNFSETAESKHIAATDWSWSALMADFNNDLYKDIFISNGILGATNDMDFIKFISDKTYQDKINKGLKSEDLKLLDRLPKYKKYNKLFLNSAENVFTDDTQSIENHTTTYSNGATYADLDLDGDLDLVVNNINANASLYENVSSGNYLNLKLEGYSPNRNGIGAKLIAFIGNQRLIRENYVNIGYMSSSHNAVHFGLGKNEKADSLWIIWPNQRYQSIKNVVANQYLKVNQTQADKDFDYSVFQTENLLEQLSSSEIPFEHFEHTTYEFSRKPLIPYSNGNLGPKIAVEDVNNDGLEDIFIGNAKLKSGKLFLQQKDHSFQSVQEELFEEHKTAEDLDQKFVDIDNDGDKDLIVVSGGNEFKQGKNLQPRLYINNDGQFTLAEAAFPEVNEQFNTIALVDVNADGFVDVFMASGVHYETFGKSPKSYLFINQKDNTFTDATEAYFLTHELGMIRDADFVDLNNDGSKELILAGHFMPIQVYSLENNTFKALDISAFKKSNGLWNTLYVVDIDNDGYKDIFVGNFGTNTKLKASKETPIRLRINDFNNNQSDESILSYYKNDKEVLFNTKDELSSQIPQLNKKFRTYKAFAEADITEVFKEDILLDAEVKEVYTLKSMFFRNNGDLNFTPVSLPEDVDYSAVYSAIHDDFDADGNTELLLMGNHFNLNTQLGQLDANRGLFLKYKDNAFKVIPNQNLKLNKRVNSAEFIEVNKQKWLILGINNDSLNIFRNAK